VSDEERCVARSPLTPTRSCDSALSWWNLTHNSYPLEINLFSINQEDISIMSANTCLTCNSSFDSRNKLFKHLKNCGSSSQIANDSNGGVGKCSIQDGSLIDLHTSHKVIFVCGGRIRGRTLASVESFSFRTNAWEKLPPMIENRGSHVTYGLGHFIYAFGGGGFESNLATCEKYDTRYGVWNKIPPMSTYRHALAAASIGADIFLVGGWVEGIKCSKDVEVFDTLTETWSLRSPLLLAR